MSCHPESPTGKNWAAEAVYHAGEIGYTCDCGRHLTREKFALIRDPEGFVVQGLERKYDVRIFCRCRRSHSAKEILRRSRYEPIPPSLVKAAKRTLYFAVDSLNKVYAREEASRP